MGKQSVEGAVRVCFAGRRPEPERARERGGGPRGDLDQRPMRQGFLDCIKETLGATEAQWKVLEPQLAKVTALSRETGARPRPGFGRGDLPGGSPGGVRGGGPATGQGAEVRERRPMSELAKATEALETALDDPQTLAEEIRARLKVLREIRRRGKQQLAEARAVVLGLVAPRQEAQLVLMGILD